ncbi:hypothetical protein TREES_T100004527 [Tupaia chinensis]|uniref:Uncharacterized protein n=1 Tax=Tupaia chinensis TaxID=246437 RepID=L9JSS6_TUPCH|nr:hypothetical protein TREES_T100004527 [Tupaia chinensis]
MGLVRPCSASISATVPELAVSLSSASPPPSLPQPPPALQIVISPWRKQCARLSSPTGRFSSQVCVDDTRREGILREPVLPFHTLFCLRLEREGNSVGALSHTRERKVKTVVQIRFKMLKKQLTQSQSPPPSVFLAAQRKSYEDRSLRNSLHCRRKRSFLSSHVQSGQIDSHEIEAQRKRHDCGFVAAMKRAGATGAAFLLRLVGVAQNPGKALLLSQHVQVRVLERGPQQCIKARQRNAQERRRRHKS